MVTSIFDLGYQTVISAHRLFIPHIIPLYIAWVPNNMATTIYNKCMCLCVYVVDPPEVDLHQARLGQYLGKETFLLCYVSAQPYGVMIWEKDGKDLRLDR